MAYAMFINLFLFGAEIFREYYSQTHHLIHFQYLFGAGDYGSLADRALRVAGAGLQRGGVLAVPDPPDAQEPDHAQHRRCAHLLRRLCGEGRSARHPGVHAIDARARSTPYATELDRAPRLDGYLRRRRAVVHPDGQRRDQVPVLETGHATYRSRRRGAGRGTGRGRELTASARR